MHHSHKEKVALCIRMIFFYFCYVTFQEHKDFKDKELPFHK
jgi:hypothetical protein